ncbi:MAG: outer membrane lipoprotein-sorting protein [Myxococcales bacterium]
MRKLLAAAMTVAIATAVVPGLALADPKGDAVAKRYYDLKKPADTKAPGSTMVLIDKAGNRKNRKVDIFYQQKPEGKNALMVFSEPADVAGTKFLTYGHKGADSDQRLYLPALKKVRKIAAAAKDGELVNSDLWFYDLEERYFEDNTYQLLAENETIADKAFEGMKFNKIEMTPTKPSCPYSKAIAWANADNGHIYKLDCFDKKDGSLLKTILFVKVETFKGMLVPTQMVVTNHKKGTKTLMQLNGVEVNSGLADDVFSVKNLEQ